MKRTGKITKALLRAIRASGETNYAISKATGIDQTALGRFISGKRSLTLQSVDQLAEHLQLSLRKDGTA